MGPSEIDFILSFAAGAIVMRGLRDDQFASAKDGTRGVSEARGPDVHVYPEHSFKLAFVTRKFVTLHEKVSRIIVPFQRALAL